MFDLQNDRVLSITNDYKNDESRDQLNCTHITFFLS